MTGSLIFFPNFKESKEPMQLNYHMSINNRQAIQKSCIDRRSNVWLTLGSESETVVCDTLNFFRSIAGHGIQFTKWPAAPYFAQI